MADCTLDHWKLAENPDNRFCGRCGFDFSTLLRVEKDSDYVTVLACTNPQRALVCVMHYDKAQDSYVLGRMSDALAVRAARALAESWAAALKLEVR